MNEIFSYWAYSSAWKITKLLPAGIAYAIFQRIADGLYRRNPKPVQRLRSNYQRVHPDMAPELMEALVKEGMRSYLRYWCDTFRLPSWTRQQTLDSVRVDNEEYLRKPLQEGRGVVVSLPHAGNWDHAGAYFCASGAPLVTVAEHLKPEKLFAKFLAYRHSIGMEVLDANARSLAILSQRLRNNRLVALVADRDLSNTGVEVTFLDGTSRMPPGPALLAIGTGAPLITAFVRYEKRGIHIIFGEEIPVPHDGDQQSKIARMTQECADRFGEHIQQYTSDWHMLQRIWIDENSSVSKP